VAHDNVRVFIKRNRALHKNSIFRHERAFPEKRQYLFIIVNELDKLT